MKNKYLFVVMVLTIVMISLSPIFAEDSNASYLNSSSASTNDVSVVNSNDYNNLSVNTNNDDNDVLEDNPTNTNTYYVNSSSDNENQMETPTIQETINNASAGDTIIIKGNFVHVHLVIDKPLIIIGNSSSLSTCPSRTTGSGSIGVFYLNPQTSGTVISGFTILNSGTDSASYSVRPYGIYINGADNISIENCTVKTYTGYGILFNNSSNDKLYNLSISSTTSGRKTNTGINISKNCSNISVDSSNISSNGFAGIALESGDNIGIYNNYIMDNRNEASQSSATVGYGIFVDCPVNGVYIKGNTILRNGNYGVFNNYRVNNLNTTNEIIDNNIIMNHTERVVYTVRYILSDGGPYVYDEATDSYVYVGAGNGTYDTAANSVYLYSNFVRGTVCGATLYGYDKSSYTGKYDLVLSDIQQVDKAIYNISLIRKDNGEIANGLNTYYAIFYLNKNGNAADPQQGDVYRYCTFVNGTATCNFTNESYKKTANVITAVGPGIGNIGNPNRLYATYNVNDSDIVNPITTLNTNISSSDLTEEYGDNKNMTVKLVDELGAPVSDKNVLIIIGTIMYTSTTDSNGVVYITTDGMPAGNYTVSYRFTGDSSYNPCNGSSNLVINKAAAVIDSTNLTKVYGDSGSRYIVYLLDSNNNPIANQAISFTICGKTYNRTTDANGSASLAINLKVGKYTINVRYPGDSNYKSSSKTNTVTVVNRISYPTKLVTKDLSKVYLGPQRFSAKLVDSNNNPLVNQTVKFTVCGKTYSKTTNASGEASLAINLKPGTYKISTKYAGNSIYDSSSASNTIKVSKISTKITANNVYKQYKTSTPYVIKLVDSNNKPIANQKVKITISGKTYSRTTNANGEASLAINLKVGKYSVKTTYSGSSIYMSSSKTNTVTVVKNAVGKATKIVGSNLNKSYLDPQRFAVNLVDSNNNPLANQTIKLTVCGKTYSKITDANGGASLAINLKPGNYNMQVVYSGNSAYQGTSASYKVVVNPTTTITTSYSNSQAQAVLNEAKTGSTIYFKDYNMDDVNLVINKSLTLEGGNSTVTGLLNNPVFTVNAEGVSINNFNIVAKNSTGINILKGNSKITNNNLNNTLFGDNISSYYSGDKLFSGNGINVESSRNIIENNIISLYYNGIYLKNSNNDSIIGNDIEKNNFGIYYGANVSNTEILSNNISNNIGQIDFENPEGFYGYGIFANQSSVNLTIGRNNIISNYIGVNFNAPNSTGINMYDNLVYNSTLEGVVFWPNYTPVNGEYPTVENNAIFDNAKGPAMFTLGEMSANPNGIYAPGANDSSKALHIGYNWFGVNRLVTWVQDETVGAGTMCPRIRANAICFTNLTYVSPGKYNVYFLRNGTLADELPDFRMFVSLNDIESTFEVHNGVGTISLDPSVYLTNETNIIKISSGSLNDEERTFKVIFIYEIPEDETD